MKGNAVITITVIKKLRKSCCVVALLYITLIRMAVKKYVAARLVVIYDSQGDQQERGRLDVIVPDMRSRILEVVIVRRLLTWVLGIWSGEGMGKG